MCILERLEPATSLKKGGGGAHETNEPTSDSTIVRSIRLQLGSIRQLASVKSLVLEALVEANICDTDAEPSHKAKQLSACITKARHGLLCPPGYRRHVGEPLENST
jgi:hypothetical protein